MLLDPGELNVPTTVPIGWFPPTVEGESSISVGACVTGLTLIVNISSVDNPFGSVERTRIE